MLLCGEGRQMGVKADRMGSERAAIALLTLSPLELGTPGACCTNKAIFLNSKNPSRMYIEVFHVH